MSHSRMTRRLLLSGLLGGAGTALAARPAAAAVAAPGRLAYQNTAQVGVFTFSTATQRLLTPAPAPLERSGFGSSSSNTLVTSLEGDNAGVELWFGKPNGTQQRVLRVPREFAFVTGVPAFSPNGARVAVSVDEYDAGVDDRVDRTLVLDAATGAVVKRFTTWAYPVWTRAGELLLANATSGKVVSFGTNLVKGPPVGVTLFVPRNAAYDASADGRYVVHEDSAGDIAALDRRTGARWKAVTSIQTLRTPTVSPDGRFVAFVGPGPFSVYAAVVPLAAGTTVTYDATRDLLPGALAGVSGRMAWLS